MAAPHRCGAFTDDDIKGAAAAQSPKGRGEAVRREGWPLAIARGGCNVAGRPAALLGMALSLRHGAERYHCHAASSGSTTGRDLRGDGARGRLLSDESRRVSGQWRPTDLVARAPASSAPESGGHEYSSKDHRVFCEALRRISRCTHSVTGEPLTDIGRAGQIVGANNTRL